MTKESLSQYLTRAGLVHTDAEIDAMLELLASTGPGGNSGGGHSHDHHDHDNDLEANHAVTSPASPAIRHDEFVMQVAKDLNYCGIEARVEPRGMVNSWMTPAAFINMNNAEGARPLQGCKAAAGALRGRCLGAAGPLRDRCGIIAGDHRRVRRTADMRLS